MKTSLGVELKRFRTRANLTQSQVADSLGVTSAYVQNMESGRRGIGTARTLFVLADLFGVLAEHFRPWVLAEPESAKKGRRKAKEDTG